MKQKLTIIGVGNMGRAIASQLLQKQLFTPEQLTLCNPTTSKLGEFISQGVTIMQNNKSGIKKADILLLAVKPQKMFVVLEEIKSVIRKDQLIISIAAGISLFSIEETIEQKLAIVRVMPNLGAQVGQSVSVWVKNEYVTADQKKIIEEMLQAIGIVIAVTDEEHIDMLTPISGSGPAFFFYLTELLEKAACAFGFSQETAAVIAKQTMLGSAEVLRDSKSSPETLRKAVTSKHGVTEKVLEIFEKEKLPEIVTEGIHAGFERAKELGNNT